MNDLTTVLQRKRAQIEKLQREVEVLSAAEALLRQDQASERMHALWHVSGVAIALQQGPVMACVASAGTAPELGTAIRTEEGLSGECLRSAQTIYCQSTLTDPRLNPELCRSLKLGSI